MSPTIDPIGTVAPGQEVDVSVPLLPLLHPVIIKVIGVFAIHLACYCLCLAVG